MFSVKEWKEWGVSWKFAMAEETKYNEILWLTN